MSNITLERPQPKAAPRRKPAEANQPTQLLSQQQAIPVRMRDEIDAALWQAGAVTKTLEDLFARAFGDPDLYAEGDLTGAMQHAKWQLAEAARIATSAACSPPGDLRSRIEEARSLICLVEAMETNTGNQFRQDCDVYCGYFAAINTCINRAMAALQEAST